MTILARLGLRPLWHSTAITHCRRCALGYVRSDAWPHCPGCEARAGRRFRERVEALLMEGRGDRSK